MGYALVSLLMVLIMISCYQIASLLQTSTLILSARTEITFVNKLPDMSAWHLFGIYQARLNADDIPRTSLNLQLVGVFMAHDKTNSEAIIRVADGGEKTYRIGDMVTDDTKIYQVLADSVILECSGHYEVLPLPVETIKFNHEGPEAIEVNQPE